MKSFKQRLFLSLMAVALVPVALALGASWFALREALVGAGAAGPWSEVGNSGGALLDLIVPYAEGDSMLRNAAELHGRALSESVRFSLMYELLTNRFLRLAPVLVLSLGTLIVVFSTAAARRLARGLSRPVEALVGWTDLIAGGESLPSRDPPTGSDVAELVRLEEALRSMASELERGRRRDLEATRLRTWSAMARRVAHELKNPLTPIRFAASSVARRPEPEIQEAGEVILEEVGRLDEMARSFAQLGRLPEGPPSEVDLLELLTALARSHSGSRVAVSIQHSGGDPMMVGHLRPLERVFRNLLANALEAMEAMDQDPQRLSVDITLDTETGNGDVAVGGITEDFLVVVIEDQGPGLPPELLQDLWIPDFTTKRRGTGLGLALVKQTVELHGGSVGAENRLQGGARFIVRLPRHASGTTSPNVVPPT